MVKLQKRGFIIDFIRSFSHETNRFKCRRGQLVQASLISKIKGNFSDQLFDDSPTSSFSIA